MEGDRENSLHVFMQFLDRVEGQYGRPVVDDDPMRNGVAGIPTGGYRVPEGNPMVSTPMARQQFVNQNQVPIDEEFYRQRLQNPPNPVNNRQTFQPNICQVMNQNQVPIGEAFFRQRLQNLPNHGDNRQTFQPNSSCVAQNQTSFGASGGTKQKKPPTFDGKGSFRDFLVQFEMISRMCQWDERMIALELIASFKGFCC